MTAGPWNDPSPGDQAMPSDRPKTDAGKIFARCLAGDDGGGSWGSFVLVTSKPDGLEYTDMDAEAFTLGGVIACIEGWLEDALTETDNPFADVRDVVIFHKGQVCAVLKRAG